MVMCTRPYPTADQLRTVPPRAWHGQSAADRLANGYVTDETGCWLWTKAIATSGYGQMWAGTHVFPAHRLMYILHRADVSPDLEMDHLCRNRACVNPDHLEPVTAVINVRRGVGRSMTCRCRTSHL